MAQFTPPRGPGALPRDGDADMLSTRLLPCPLALAPFILLLAAPAAALTPYAYKPLPVGSVTPKGWLLKQLTLQADGLSGHLAQFWNDVMNSVWKGGSGDGGLHERTPYWLNGVVPLAFLLRNAGVEQLDPVLGIYKVGLRRLRASHPSPHPLPRLGLGVGLGLGLGLELG